MSGVCRSPVTAARADHSSHSKACTSLLTIVHSLVLLSSGSWRSADKLCCGLPSYSSGLLAFQLPAVGHELRRTGILVDRYF